MRRVFIKVFNSLPLLLILLLAVCLLLFPEVTVSGAHRGLTICRESIIPALFPYFVFTNLWCSLGYADKLSHITATLMETVFHLPGSAASALTLGLIGGYPTGAQILVRQYKHGELSKDEAEHLILFCNNAGPAFIFGMVGSKVFDSVQVGFALFLIHAISAIILGVLFRKHKKEFCRTSSSVARRPSFPTAVTDAIKQAGSTALQVCVFVVFFSVLLSYLCSFLPEHWINTLTCKFVLGILELAGGVDLFLNCENKAAAFCLISFLLGFGGICVFFQTLSLLDDTDLSKRKYLFSKTLHAMLSFLLSVILVPFMPLSGNALRTHEPVLLGNFLSWVLLLAILLLFVCFLKNTSGKARSNQV